MRKARIQKVVLCVAERMPDGKTLLVYDYTTSTVWQARYESEKLRERTGVLAHRAEIHRYDGTIDIVIL